MSDIFISHAREDRAKAQLLANIFRLRGWSVFLPENIQAGTNWGQTIAQELAMAKVVVALLSPHYFNSKWTLTEAQIGARRGILVPVAIARVDLSYFKDIAHSDPIFPVDIHSFLGKEVNDLSGWNGDDADPRLQAVLFQILLLAEQKAMLRAESVESMPEPSLRLSSDHYLIVIARAATAIATVIALFLFILFAATQFIFPAVNAVVPSAKGLWGRLSAAHLVTAGIEFCLLAVFVWVVRQIIEFVAAWRILKAANQRSDGTEEPS